MAYQQKQDTKNKEEDIVEIEDENIDVGISKQNKMMILIIGAVFVSVVFYFLIFKKSEEIDMETPKGELIIQEQGGVAPIKEVTLQDPFALESQPFLDTNAVLTKDDFNTKKVGIAMPSMPDVPELSPEIKEQIAKSIIDNNQSQQEKSKQLAQEETYTKDQVDKMVEDKVKEMLEQKISEINPTTENKVTKNTNIDTIETPQKATAVVDDDPFAVSTATLDPEEEALKKQQLRESDELLKMQRQRALQERKAAPIFTMSGGGGGNSVPEDGESIILTYSSSRLAVQNKAPDVVPSQIADLTSVVLQGKVINAVLETAIDTDIPSTVRAVITRDVYAEEGKNILIPRGSRIVGIYATDVAIGQTRVTINWNRIIRVDGMSLNISSVGADRLGRAGVAGETDNKYAQRIANSFLSSFLSVGTAIVAEKVSGSTGIESTVNSLTGGTTTTKAKASDTALVNATTNIMNETKAIVDEIAKQKPAIRIPQGEKVVIMVTQDITLPIFKRSNK
jgi:type IV secretion system protein VirB10